MREAEPQHNHSVDWCPPRIQDVQGLAPVLSGRVVTVISSFKRRCRPVGRVLLEVCPGCCVGDGAPVRLQQVAELHVKGGAAIRVVSMERHHLERWALTCRKQRQLTCKSPAWCW